MWAVIMKSKRWERFWEKVSRERDSRIARLPAHRSAVRMQIRLAVAIITSSVCWYARLYILWHTRCIWCA